MSINCVVQKIYALSPPFQGPEPRLPPAMSAFFPDQPLPIFSAPFSIHLQHCPFHSSLTGVLMISEHTACICISSSLLGKLFSLAEPHPLSGPSLMVEMTF